MERSLDLTGLVPDLDDRDPLAIFTDALEQVQINLDGYTPANGSLDVVILEAVSLAVSDAIYAANRIPAAVLTSVLGLMDIPRDLGARTTGTVEVTLDGARPTLIDAGHRFEVDGVEFLASVSTSSGDASFTVPVVASDVGAISNGIPAGTDVEVLDPIPAAVAAQTVGAFTGGVEPESQEVYAARSATWLSRMSSALLLPSAYVAWALGQPDVSRAVAVDVFDVTDTGAPGDHPGHITVFLHGRGAALSASRLSVLAADVAARSAAHLVTHVAPATIVDVEVALSVQMQSGQDAPAIQSAVAAALAEQVSPRLWNWEDPLTVAEISAIAARVPGVDYVTAVTLPASTVTFDAGELPQATPVTVGIA